MSFFLVIDLEATCWDDRTLHPGENEIIEIGLALLSPNKELLLNQGWFVRPTMNPTLSEFCTKLTSITQDQVDQAKTLPEVMKEFETTVVNLTAQPISESLFISWGNYDRNQFLHDCQLHNYPYPFGQHLNLKESFRTKYKHKKVGMAAALKYLNLPLLGTHHRGKDDALNIAAIFRLL